MVNPTTLQRPKQQLTQEQRAQRTEQQRKRRANQNETVRQALRENNTNSRKRQRSEQSNEIAEAIQRRDTIAHRSKKTQSQQGSSHSAMLHTMEIFRGQHMVAPYNLADRDVCDYCHALLWEHEKSLTRICCHRGRMQLTPWKMPHPQTAQFRILDLWADQGSDGKLMRRFSRQLNNALALASQKVEEFSPSDGGWAPNVIIQGRLHHCVGPLQADIDSTPSFAQIYLHDTEHDMEEADIRLRWMRLPKGTTTTTSARLHNLLMKLQDLLRQCNPYIHDYVAACEIPEKDVENQTLVINADAMPTGEHARRYNCPEGWKEVALLIGDNGGFRDITLRFQGGGMRNINETHRSFDALHFVLLFPEGDDCWNLSLHRQHKITVRDYYAFHLHERENQRNSLFYASRLFQEYCCMAFAKIESQRLRYLATHQSEIRSELYQNISDAIMLEDHTGHIGQRVILPASFTGGPRDMHRRYQDAMAIVRVHGKPDLFITMTCNPDWEEITKALLPGQQPKDRPDVVARVFKGYVKQLLHEIIDNNIFGEIVAILYVIEFQKRGLPHAHILVILSANSKLRTPELIDAVVCAELPEDDLLCSIVGKCMIHNECGPNNSNAHCMKNDKCTRRFPKDFINDTIWEEADTHPKYRRRAPGAGGRTVKIGDRIVDNSWVVPYNPYLTLRFQCHINVEVCSSVKACKYLFKYVYKGHDRAMVHISKDNANNSSAVEHRDEIKEYQDLRSIGASEACWRIFEFDMSERSPAVMALPIHLENQQHVYFEQGEELQVLNHQRPSKLMAWFDYNSRHPNITPEEQHLYCDFPRYFTWDDKLNVWNPRVNLLRFQTLGRINSVHPSVGELFYLRILLHNSHAKGKKNFNELRLANGKQCNTYQEACQELGLLIDDGECDIALRDATLTKMSPQIRQLFVILLEFCSPLDPLRLFNTHFDAMTDDFQRRLMQTPELTDPSFIRAMVLLDIESRLQGRGKELRTFNLPNVSKKMRKDIARFNHQSERAKMPQELFQELDYNQEKLIQIVAQRQATLLPSQRLLVTDVLHAVETKSPLAIFVDAPGGTGKTYCFNTLLAAVRARGEIALAVATSGIAATLLDGGRTFHSRFNAPLIPTATSTCGISAQTTKAEVIRRAAIIIWDEAPMANRYHLEALDRTLCDLMESELPFGGKVIVLGGDF